MDVGGTSNFVEGEENKRVVTLTTRSGAKATLGSQSGAQGGGEINSGAPAETTTADATTTDDDGGFELVDKEPPPSQHRKKPQRKSKMRTLWRNGDAPKNRFHTDPNCRYLKACKDQTLTREYSIPRDNGFNGYPDPRKHNNCLVCT